MSQGDERGNKLKVQQHHKTAKFLQLPKEKIHTIEN